MKKITIIAFSAIVLIVFSYLCITNVKQPINYEKKVNLSSDYYIEKNMKSFAIIMTEGNEIAQVKLRADQIVVDEYGTYLAEYRPSNMFYEEDKQILLKLQKEGTLVFTNVTEKSIELEDVYVDYTKKIAPTYQMSQNSFLSYGPSLLGFDEKKDILKKKNVVIGVIDSGLTEPTEELMPYLDLDKAYDFVNNDSDLYDPTGDEHQTMVLSCVVDSLKQHFTTDDFKIIPVKALECNRGSEYDIQRAIYYMIEQKVDVVNCSYGSDFYSSYLKAAYDKAEAEGIIVVAAAGNEAGGVSAPAIFSSTIAVSSINESKQLSEFSNYGDSVQFTAPGEDIGVYIPGGEIVLASGTSFSCPFLVAVIAYTEVTTGISDKVEMINYLVSEQYVEDLGDGGRDIYYGYGLPKVKKVDPSTSSPTPISTPGPEDGVDDTEDDKGYLVSVIKITMPVGRESKIDVISYNNEIVLGSSFKFVVDNTNVISVTKDGLVKSKKQGEAKVLTYYKDNLIGTTNIEVSGNSEGSLEEKANLQISTMKRLNKNNVYIKIKANQQFRKYALLKKCKGGGWLVVKKFSKITTKVKLKKGKKKIRYTIAGITSDKRDWVFAQNTKKLK